MRNLQIVQANTHIPSTYICLDVYKCDVQQFEPLLNVYIPSDQQHTTLYILVVIFTTHSHTKYRCCECLYVCIYVVWKWICIKSTTMLRNIFYTWKKSEIEWEYIVNCVESLCKSTSKQLFCVYIRQWDNITMYLCINKYV